MISKEEGIQYTTTKAAQGFGRMIFYRQSHCHLDFIQLQFSPNLNELPLVYTLT